MANNIVSDSGVAPDKSSLPDSTSQLSSKVQAASLKSLPVAVAEASNSAAISSPVASSAGADVGKSLDKSPSTPTGGAGQGDSSKESLEKPDDTEGDNPYAWGTLREEYFQEVFSKHSRPSKQPDEAPELRKQGFPQLEIDLHIANGKKDTNPNPQSQASRGSGDSTSAPAKVFIPSRENNALARTDSSLNHKADSTPTDASKASAEEAPYPVIKDAQGRVIFKEDNRFKQATNYKSDGSALTTVYDKVSGRSGVTADDGKGNRSTIVMDRNGMIIGSKSESRDAAGKLVNQDGELYDEKGIPTASFRNSAA